jgi:hypothetical protein
MRPIGLILSCCLLLAACHKQVPVAALPAPPPAPPPPTVATPPPVVTPLPVPVPKPPAPPPPLRDADRAFIAGKYDESARLYEDYLRTNRDGNVRDQALFNEAVSLALLAPNATDWAKVTGLLKDLVDGYPKSPLKPHAVLILSLHAQIDQLNTETKQRDQQIKQLKQDLERLKKIDIAPRKRP